VGIDHTTATVVSKIVPAGNYVINAKATLEAAGDSTEARCVLRVGGVLADDTEAVGGGVVLTSQSGDNPLEVIALQAVATNFGGGTILVECNDSGAGLLNVEDPVLTAIKVTTVQ
jgi:hypothetical protein